MAEGNRISEFIDSGKFLEFFKNNLLLDEEFLAPTSDSEDVDKSERSLKKKRNFKPPGRSKISDYFSETSWGRMLLDEKFKDPMLSEGKSFRRRFRVPYCVYEYLVKITKDFNLLDYSMNFKVLIPEE